MFMCDIEKNSKESQQTCENGISWQIFDGFVFLCAFYNFKQWHAFLAQTKGSEKTNEEEKNIYIYNTWRVNVPRIILTVDMTLCLTNFITSIITYNSLSSASITTIITITSTSIMITTIWFVMELNEKYFYFNAKFFNERFYSAQQNNKLVTILINIGYVFYAFKNKSFNKQKKAEDIEITKNK